MKPSQLNFLVWIPKNNHIPQFEKFIHAHANYYPMHEIYETTKNIH
jgi:hypothetical protein